MLLSTLNLLAAIPAEVMHQPVAKQKVFLHNSFSNTKHLFLF
jgi:hypothetical protein